MPLNDKEKNWFEELPEQSETEFQNLPEEMKESETEFYGHSIEELQNFLNENTHLKNDLYHNMRDICKLNKIIVCDMGNILTVLSSDHYSDDFKIQHTKLFIRNIIPNLMTSGDTIADLMGLFHIE